MQAPAAAARNHVTTSWVVFYLVVLLAWVALADMAMESGPAVVLPMSNPVLADHLGMFLARCLASVSGLNTGHLIAMWALMSLGMMLPTAAPTLQRLAALLGDRPQATQHFLAFCGGYLVVWFSFSLLAAMGQSLLAGWELIDADGRVESGFSAAVLFGFAGAYQFSRLKHACLSRCRHPMTFFMAHWRPGFLGAASMGLRHGRDCLGCCWPLMLLAFVGGTMNLAWMGLAMVLMLLEKLVGTGRYVTAPLGVMLIFAAGFALGNAMQSV